MEAFAGEAGIGQSIDLFAPWWNWTPENAGFGDYAYRWFNLFEAAAWFLFACAVWRRWRRTHHSPLELLYATAFVAFGLTDVVEAWQQSLPLLALKGAVLATLLLLRHHIRKQWYPESSLY
ncbi:hypothetical protein Pan44_40880 [Caulifigura coniformis]|uniref:Uncharacterized protein n=1 Tax=Caulifigura coniformis TaxID=2527983 RepID=A0A517SIS5_9PLAN|nr:hypothetical protein [Caulifigura coniformis]QDT56038.1 hypothetical protein Pan44_40880 [Caulifigura coniformis]